MLRRKFLKTAAAFSLAAIHSNADTGGFITAPGPWRQYELTTRVEILHVGGPVRAWIPLANFSENDWIRPLRNDFIAAGATTDQSPAVVSFQWPAGPGTCVAQVRSRVSTRDRFVDLSNPASAVALSDADRRRYTSATKLIATDGSVAETAAKIRAGAHDDLDKAQRIYEWIVINTFRDPKVRGCGVGNISSMLTTGNLGGKCADLNALFVGLARAAGLPARDLYGIRVAPSQFDYKVLGAGSSVVTKAQHCRAEVYLSKFGWVPVDPADVRKVVLEEPPGKLEMDDPKVAAARRTLFGAWEGNWIAYNDLHDVALPGSAGSTLGFLMYPQAETSAGRLDCLDPDQFKYTITVSELADRRTPAAPAQ